REQRARVDGEPVAVDRDQEKANDRRREVESGRGGDRDGDGRDDETVAELGQVLDERDLLVTGCDGHRRQPRGVAELYPRGGSNTLRQAFDALASCTPEANRTPVYGFGGRRTVRCATGA